MPEPKVHFVVPGSGKAGTTWLHACLHEHPGVFVPACKEVNFFTRHYDRGTPWYFEHFAKAQPGQVVGELSPSYMFDDPDVPRRMARDVPDAKLLFIVRHPVDRAYSHYCMQLTAERIDTRIQQHIQPGQPFFDHSLYWDSLQRFLQHFDPQQIKVLVYDDLQSDPHRFFRDTLSFIGADPDFQTDHIGSVMHGRKSRKRFHNLHAFLAKRLGSLTHAGPRSAAFVYRLRRSKLVAAYHRLNRGDQFPPLTPEHRRQLNRAYEPDVQALSQWLGRDLTGWLDD